MSVIRPASYRPVTEKTPPRLPLLVLLALGLLWGAGARGQGLRNGAGQRDLRGVWMATVLNIDYPSRPTADAATLQAEFRSQLYRLRQAGVNALFVQVRPAGDAIYPSQHAPWSRWLTGRQGVAPVSNFDPLKFMIEECHARGVELHAWVNPYRVAMSLDSFNFAPGHLFHRHRDWVRLYADRMYLDPGLPAVRQHLGRVIDELVAGYDLDGIHFDDYFYPYPLTGVPFPDEATYRRYGNGRPRADWRRANVNAFVTETYHRIKAAKPWMQFGISPYGVWRNQSRDPARGSATRASISSYDDLYGDALAWAEAGVVDYLAPQLYWNVGYAPADYGELLRWWATHVPPTTRLLIGQAAYKVGDPDQGPAWADPDQLPTQVRLNRAYPSVDGTILFSARSILGSAVGLEQRLARLYPELALLPPRANRGPAPAAPPPPKVFRPRRTEAGNLVVWEVPRDTPAEALPHYYAIYRSDPAHPLRLLHRTPYGQGCHRLHYVDKTAATGVDYRYRVVALDRFHNAAPVPAR